MHAHAYGDAITRDDLADVLRRHPVDAADPDALVLQAAARLAALRDAWIATPDHSDNADNALGAAVTACERIIAETPARAPAALAAKVRMLIEGLEYGATNFDEAAARTLLAALEEMAHPTPGG